MASLTQLTFSRLRPSFAAPSRSRHGAREPRRRVSPSRRRPPCDDHPNCRLSVDRSSLPSAPRPYSFSGGGGDATTYTRLPPKDDFVLPDLPSLGRLAQVEGSSEIKLRDSAMVTSVAAEESFAESWFEEDIDVEVDEEKEEEEVDEDEEDEIFEGLAIEGFGDEESETKAFVGVGDEVDGDEEEGEEKDKGVPAVMRCFDRSKIYVKAGDGGNGVVAFRREKYVPYGGPSGGDGGRGGNVYIEVDGSMNSLLPFRKNVHFRAGRGGHGQGRNQAGAKGEDVVVNVAPGTVIRESIKGGFEGEVLLELMHPGQRALLLPGGRGGRGNASFKSGTNRIPKIAENGEEGAEM